MSTTKVAVHFHGGIVPIPAPKAVREAKFEAKEEEYVLMISIKNARRLIQAGDRNGLADPYCVVRVEDARLRTGELHWGRQTFAISNTLNPEWMSDTEIGIGARVGKVVFEVWDWNSLTSDKKIGSCEVPIASLNPGVASALTLELKNDAKKAAGDLNVEINIVRRDGPKIDAREEVSMQPAGSFQYKIFENNGASRQMDDTKLACESAKHWLNAVRTSIRVISFQTETADRGAFVLIWYQVLDPVAPSGGSGAPTIAGTPLASVAAVAPRV